MNDIIQIFGVNKSAINESIIEFYDENHYGVNESPISSFMTPSSTLPGKCFTYLSALKEYWNSFQFDLNSIVISIINDYREYPPLGTLGFFAIHPNNIIPSYNNLDYFHVKPNALISVKYSQLNTELLIDSNCFEYDISNEHDKMRMQSDCLVQCYVEFMVEKLNSW